MTRRACTDCGDPSFARHLCKRCYNRHYTAGDLPPKSATPDVPARYGPARVASYTLPGLYLFDTPDMPGAACTGHHDVYDHAAQSDTALSAALTLCHMCPHTDRCLTHATDHPGIVGLWGGRWFGPAPKNRRPTRLLAAVTYAQAPT
ncbi:MAG: WhiB family transcriptional regulator [Nocardioidaceae bacterium]